GLTPPVRTGTEPPLSATTATTPAVMYGEVGACRPVQRGNAHAITDKENRTKGLPSSGCPPKWSARHTMNCGHPVGSQGEHLAEASAACAAVHGDVSETRRFATYAKPP